MSLRSPLCLLLIITLSACATRQDTGRAVTAVGIAAVVVAANLAQEQGCFESHERQAPNPISCARPDDGTKKTAAVLGAAGMGAALLGQALQHQPRGPDVNPPARSAQVGGPGPWRLFRLSRMSFGADAGAPRLPPDPAPAGDGGSATAELLK